MSVTSPSVSLVPQDGELQSVRSVPREASAHPWPPATSRGFVSKPSPCVVPLQGVRWPQDSLELRSLRLFSASLPLPGTGPPLGLCCVGQGQGQGQGPRSGPFRGGCVCMQACARLCARVDTSESPRAGSPRTQDRGVASSAGRAPEACHRHRTASRSWRSRKAASGITCPGPQAHLPSPVPRSLVGSGPQMKGADP